MMQNIKSKIHFDSSNDIDVIHEKNSNEVIGKIHAIIESNVYDNVYWFVWMPLHNDLKYEKYKNNHIK